ncbi:MAG: PH domain-containing protein [Armatimonadetes bacterium]|nr:PH domain-containing protein [Armatimonadota bacterium]
MPSPEQIGAWLGGFDGAWFVPLRPREPWERAWLERPRPTSERARARVALLQLSAAIAVATALAGWAAAASGDRVLGTVTAVMGISYVVLAVAATVGQVGGDEPSNRAPAKRQRGRRRARLAASPATLSVHGAGNHHCLPWSSLTRVETDDGETVLHWSDGVVIRLPDDQGLEPVISVAQRIMAARVEQDDALQARMERGLSRPDDDQRADRGISLMTAEEPAERDERSMPRG